MAIATDASREIMMCQFAWRYTRTDRSHRDFKSSNAPEISWCFWTHCTIHRQGVASKDLNPTLQTMADPSGCAVSGVHLRPLVFWDCGFESCREYGYVSIECCVFSSIGLCIRLLAGQVNSAVTYLTFLVLDSARA
jgi:hypothetical protein